MKIGKIIPSVCLVGLLGAGVAIADTYGMEIGSDGFLLDYRSQSTRTVRYIPKNLRQGIEDLDDDPHLNIIRFAYRDSTGLKLNRVSWYGKPMGSVSILDFGCEMHQARALVEGGDYDFFYDPETNEVYAEDGFFEDREYERIVIKRSPKKCD